MTEGKRGAMAILPGEEGEHTVQACIRRALSYLSEKDQRAFLKSFRDHEGNEHQQMHTFRELLVGACLARSGFTPRYEPEMEKQTPDWHFARGSEEFFSDVVNFHNDIKTEAEVMRALGGEGVRMWSGWLPDHGNRLYPSIQNKAAKYKALALDRKMPFVVFVYGLFTAALMPYEVDACLLPEDGLFNQYPTLSGVYHMREEGNCWRDVEAGYRFDFYANPNAIHPAPWLSSARLPYLFPARTMQS